MSTRKAHNKTRLGCSQCKKRRIKCDCTHPICLNCSKKGLECGFMLLAPSSQLSIRPSSSGGSSRERLDPDISLSPHRVQVVRRTSFEHLDLPEHMPTPLEIKYEPWNPFFAFPGIYPYLNYSSMWRDCGQQLSPVLRNLLRHYEYTTSLTLAGDDPARAAWQTFVPELASEHAYLVHGVLSVAALHLSRITDDPKKKKEALILAAEQMNLSLELYRPTLDNVEEKNAAALFACATLTAVYFFRTSTMEIENLLSSLPVGQAPTADIIDRGIHSVQKTFWGLRGAYVVLKPGWKWVTTGKLSPVCVRKWWPKNPVPASEKALEEDRRLCKLESLWMQPGRDYESYFDSLTEALALLRETYALVSQLTTVGGSYPSMTAVPYETDDTGIGILKDRGAIFQWCVRVSREFMSLIAQKNREALVIVAHYAVLLWRVRNVWWLDNMGASMLMALAAALGRDNWYLIEWPTKVMGLDLEKWNASESVSPRSPIEMTSFGTPDEYHMNVI